MLPTGFQSLLGTSTYSGDLADFEIITADDLSVSRSTKLYDLTVSHKFTYPVGANNGYVLTSNNLGVASWQPIGSTDLLGDVTGPIINNVVGHVGGKTATEIATTVDDVIGATANPTPNTLVKRDIDGAISVSNLHATSDIFADNRAVSNKVETGEVDATGLIATPYLIKCGDPVQNAPIWQDIPGSCNATFFWGSQIKTTQSTTVVSSTNYFNYPLLTENGTVGDWAGKLLVCDNNVDFRSVWKDSKDINIYANGLRSSSWNYLLPSAAPTNGQILGFDGTNLAWTTYNPSLTLSGDVTGPLSSNVVQSVGGKAYYQIASSVDDTLAATSNNTNGTIVKRDASGGFNTASINLQASTNQLKLRETIIRSTDSTERTFTLPAVASDTFTMNAASQALTNKTIIQPFISQIRNAGTLTLPTLTDTLVGRNTTDTLTNKTLTAPIISTIVNTGTLTLPTITDTLVGRVTVDTLTNKTLTAPKISTIVNTGTLTLPTLTDTLVGRDTVDTLTNKTLTTPNISQIRNTNLLTLPNTTDTLVGRNTTDTLTNKTLTSPVISTIVNTGTLTLPTSTDTLVGRNTTDSLTNKTLISCTIFNPTLY